MIIARTFKTAREMAEFLSGETLVTSGTGNATAQTLADGSTKLTLTDTTKDFTEESPPFPVVAGDAVFISGQGGFPITTVATDELTLDPDFTLVSATGVAYRVVRNEVPRVNIITTNVNEAGDWVVIYKTTKG